MSPRIRAIALTRFEIIFNCCIGSMKFSPPPAPEMPDFGENRLGLVKALAGRLLDSGEANNYHEIAHLNGVNPDSLKAAVCRERKRRAGIKREDAA
jgi:hypothetical protein